MNKTEKDQIRNGLDRIATAMTYEYEYLQNCDTSIKDRVQERYTGLINTVELLGAEWKRDRNGQHTVCFMGTSGKSE